MLQAKDVQLLFRCLCPCSYLRLLLLMCLFFLFKESIEDILLMKWFWISISDLRRCCNAVVFPGIRIGAAVSKMPRRVARNRLPIREGQLHSNSMSEPCFYPSIVALLRCPKSLVHLESSGLPASGLLSYEHFNRRIITLLVYPGAPWIPN